MSEENAGRHAGFHVRALCWGAACLLVLGLVLGATACAESRDSDRRESDRGGVALDEPVAMPAVTLTDVRDGGPFDLASETEGFVTLLFIGYTHCPDVCPVHLSNLAAVLRELPSRVADEIRVVFVSADPARDTPERIREWLSAHDPSFIGLRGSRAEVRALEDSLGLAPSVVEGGDGPDADYFVAHASQVLAFEADDTARVAFPWGTRQRDWRRALPRLTGNGGL